MARFVGLLLMAPCLTVLGWLYWLFVRKLHATQYLARTDAWVLVAACALAIAGAMIAWQAALGHAGPIWKQVAAPLGAYAGFNLVLGLGLLRHALHHRHMTSASR